MLVTNSKGNRLNRDYFKCLDSNGAYIMGLIWADGCMPRVSSYLESEGTHKITS
jgi:hypothetical protein